MSDLIGFEVPKIDWTQGPDLVQRFRRFKQKCELLFEGPLKPRTDEQNVNTYSYGRETTGWICLTLGT